MRLSWASGSAQHYIRIDCLRFTNMLLNIFKDAQMNLCCLNKANLIEPNQVSNWLLPCGDDHDVEPVPGVSEESEASDTEASRRDLHQDLKDVDGCEDVSVPTEQSRRNKQILVWDNNQIKRNPLDQFNCQYCCVLGLTFRTTSKLIFSALQIFIVSLRKFHSTLGKFHCYIL